MKRRKRTILFWAVALVIIVAAVFAFRSYNCASYHISTTAMEGTLHKGDFILAKRLLNNKAPQRNDIVLFKDARPGQPSKGCFIGRCVGMPGDTVDFSIEGIKYKVIVPGIGYRYQVDNLLFAYQGAIVNEEGKQATFKNKELFLGGEKADSFYFGENYYWILGDNVYDAIDSHYFGFIPQNCIIGVGTFCWFSRDPQHIFKKLK